MSGVFFKVAKLLSVVLVFFVAVGLHTWQK